MSSRYSAVLALSLLLAAAPPASAEPDVPSPRSVLGFTPGEDRKLADWPQMVAWWQALGTASPRVDVAEVGRTTEGKPFLVVTITSEANMRRLDEIRGNNLRLADPRGLDAGETERRIAEGKTIVAMNYGIHSTEVGASLAAIEVGHRLATTNDPRLLVMLDQVVIVMLPSHNPDGVDIVTDWYRRTLGTPYEGTSPPQLYHRYVGHDNNRDWYMFTQVESRLTVQHLYDRWRPQIVHDVHQMGGRGARLFVPPYVDPHEPNVDPALVASITALGAHVAAALTTEGRTGVVQQALYDAWTPARAYPHTHGGVRILSETASAQLASPVEVKRDMLEPGPGYDPRERSWNFPLPWAGGAWRLRDVVDYQVAASMALLDHAAKNREHWLRTFVGVGQRAVAPRTPAAWVLPAAQRDPVATARLLEALRIGGVEIGRATDSFTAGGRTHAAGSHVIDLRQPYGAFARTLLERQDYPDRRAYEGGPPQRPYDVTAHTLPLLMGVEAVALDAPVEATVTPVDEVVVPPGRIHGSHGDWIALPHTTGSLMAATRLLGERVPVRWARHGWIEGGTRFEAGTLLVPASAQGRVEGLTQELGIEAHRVSGVVPHLRLRSPRVGLYQSWVPSMDEGWTRFVFEKQVGLPYTTLHDADVRAGSLRSRFDAIVLPDQGRAAMVQGHGERSMPPEFSGGLGKAGIEALREFVRSGGTLVALNSGTELPLADFGLGARDTLEARPPDQFYSPGAILATRADSSHPLAHGLPETNPVWFENGPAFTLDRGTAVLRYTTDKPLLSGWLLGGEHLKGRAALADVPLGRGRVVLFGFRPQYRAQSWGTYVALLNALFLSAARPQ